VPPPLAVNDTLPLEEYHSRKEELERKIQELGGKKMAKTYEKELSAGINLDPVNHGMSRLSDASSSDDSGDSSSSDGSSDSDSNSDDESPQKGAAMKTAAASSQSSAGSKRRQSPKGSHHSGVNGEKRPNPTAAFSNFAQSIKTTEASKINGSGNSTTQVKNGFTAAVSGTALSSGAAQNKPLSSTWATALSTTSVTSSPASSVNSMFQQFQKQARERNQFEQQLKDKAQTERSSNGLKNSNAPNLSESEDDEMDDVTNEGGVTKFGASHEHVVDLNEQMNLINSFESSTTT